MASKYGDVDKEIKEHRKRFLDIEGDPSRKLMPIEGYANEPLVSLEEAVKPLVSLIADVQEAAISVKGKLGDSPADQLTLDQSAAIILYSMQWPSGQISLYDSLNSTLRDANRNSLKPWFRYLKLLLTALGRLPSTAQTVYRGVKRDLREQYQPGKTVIWWGFSSCTTAIEVLSNEQFLGTSGTRTLFVIKSTSGKDIQKHSDYPSENEVLLPAARQFQVESCLSPGNGLHMVQLKEIKSPIQLIELVSETDSSTNPSPVPSSTIPKIGELKISPSSISIPPWPAQWETNGITVAGGLIRGETTNQLKSPDGLFVDEDSTLYIADYYNHRIIAWKMGASTGEVVAGGNKQDNRLNQLNHPSDVIVDRKNDSLLICDSGNRRVMRWPRRSSSTSVQQGQIVIDNIDCRGLAMDNQGSLYVSDVKKHEVRRYDKVGDEKGICVAGGNEKGNKLNQLKWPTHLFVDAQLTLYVSDRDNHRVMAWKKGAKEGVRVAGGNEDGDDLTQLSLPLGVWVDGCGNVYVVDHDNHRVMRWEKGAEQGTVVVGGKGDGSNQLSYPQGLFFDHHGHLYVADSGNNRVQRFSLIKDSH